MIGFCGIRYEIMNLICDICSEIKLLKLLPHLPGVNELMNQQNQWA